MAATVSDNSRWGAMALRGTEGSGRDRRPWRPGDMAWLGIALAVLSAVLVIAAVVLAWRYL